MALAARLFYTGSTMANTPVQHIDIVVPTGRISDLGIVPGSGIVVRNLEVGDLDEWIDVYYEGNLHRADNCMTLKGRCRVAASRLVQQYPTQARLKLPRREAVQRFQYAGVYDPASRRIEVIDTVAFSIWEAAWIPTVPPSLSVN